MTDQFDPDAIRGDIETTLTQYFYPPFYDPLKPYLVDDFIQDNGRVYRAILPSTGVLPPDPRTWKLLGAAYKLVYENDESSLDPFGSIRIMISWGSSNYSTLQCVDRGTRTITGVISTWIFTPRNQGTSQGLQAAMRLREVFGLWDRIGTCGKQVRISAIDGPQSSANNSQSDLHAHVLTATLTALESVPFVR
jgi:hypothetical protein